MQKEDETITRPRLAILLGASLFLILPLIIAIANVISQISSHVSVEEALQSNVDAEIAYSIAEQKNIDLDTSTIHEIAADGDWVAVVVSSTSPEALGNSAMMVLNRQNDAYRVVYYGTGYGKSTLVNLGVPVSLAEKLTSGGSPDYGEVIYDSYLNPDYKYPLLQKLPYQSDNLSINYHYESGLKDSDGVGIPIIQITATNATNRALGISKIRSFGYDPGDYYIVFGNFINPFTDEVIEETIEININEENQGP